MPKQYYVYIPYSDAESNDELKEGVRGWRRNYASFSVGLDSPAVLAKMPRALIHGTAQPLAALANLNPEEYVLYVMAHCNIGRPTISNTRMMWVTNRVLLTAQELSNRMLDDGLPRSIRHLKLYACYGGAIGSTHTPGSVLDSFGARLYWSLITRGCDRVQLSAYTVPLNAVVDSSTGHKRTETGERPSAYRRRWPA